MPSTPQNRPSSAEQMTPAPHEGGSPGQVGKPEPDRKPQVESQGSPSLARFQVTQVPPTESPLESRTRSPKSPAALAHSRGLLHLPPGGTVPLKTFRQAGVVTRVNQVDPAGFGPHASVVSLSALMHRSASAPS